MQASSPFTLHLALSILLGAMIGLERQWHQGIAGLRTNTLVAVGAAAFVSLPGLLHEDGSGPAHMAAYIISGIGFLGAGAILREGNNVRGLNTAASLWGTASVGAFAGSGLQVEAVEIASAILAVNLLMRPLVSLVGTLQTRFGGGAPALYRVEVCCPSDRQRDVRLFLTEAFNESHLSLRGLDGESRTDGSVMLKAEVMAPGSANLAVERMVSHLAADPAVISARWLLATTVENDPKLHPAS